MSFIDDIRSHLDDMLLAAQSNEMQKLDPSQADNLDVKIEKAGKKKEKEYQRQALIDPWFTSSFGTSAMGPYRPRFSLIANRTLKEMSLRDPIVAAIIQSRINQITAFARPQISHYDTGFKIQLKDPNAEVGEKEQQEIVALTDYILNCGLLEGRKPEDRMTFETFLKLAIRDRLTFGSVPVETIRTREGAIHSFYPVPAESIYYANKNLSDDFIQGVAEMNREAFYGPYDERGKDAQNRHELDIERLKAGEYEYVQVIDGKVVAGFTRMDLIYKLGNVQNFIDNNGYAISELEMATNVITAHLQAFAHNKLVFTHGFASKGLLHIQGDLTPAQLKNFSAQWHAQIAGSSNSWRTPILSGADNVQFIPLALSNKDMEYAMYQDHLIRLLCSIFQISPMEIGFDYLTRGSDQRTMSESNNEWKIEDSKDRGLRPLLVWIESLINDDILPYIAEGVAEKYKFCFVGMDAESKTEELARQQQAVALHTSVNDVRKELGLEPILGGDMVLNPSYMNALFRTHKLGMILEYVFGYKGASQDPQFDYIPDPSYFQHMQMLQNEMMMQEQTAAQESEEKADDKEPEKKEEEVKKVFNEPLFKAELPTPKQKVKKVAAQFNKMREQYMKSYKEIEKKMLDEVFDELETELADDRPK